MSWTESEKLNEWIQRAFENGRAEERERIIKLLEELKQYWSEKVKFEHGIVDAINVDEAIALIKGEK